jgi:serine phosphatase RsbU (regulator of sigma subunit)
MKNQIISDKNEQITSSIRYAKRIQQAILPLDTKLHSSLPHHFIIYRPKDIVSGDFYWYRQINGKLLVAVVDCTGHGVPGAFMSMIGNTLLNDIVNEQKITDPAIILENLHAGVRSALKQEQDNVETDDGLDVCLCSLDTKNGKLAFAGAKRPLYIVRNGNPDNSSPELIELKGDHESVGGRQKEEKRVFTRHEVELQTGDTVYLTSDGFSDQPNMQGKKFGSKWLKETFSLIASHSMSEQKSKLVNLLENHQWNEDQRDDITIIGIRIKDDY